MRWIRFEMSKRDLGVHNKKKKNALAILITMLWRGPQRRSGIFFNLEVPVPPKRHKKAVSGKEWKRGVPGCSIFWGTYGVRLQKRTTWQSQRSEELLSQEDGD